MDVANGRINIEEYKKLYGARLGDELKLENTQADDDRVLKEIVAQYQKYNENKRTPMKETTKIPSFLHRFIKNREQFRLYRAKNFHIARLLFLSI
ncbi:hypothetical protein H6769_01610 [Candidatus Peribacteria bacterium]|nr:hypothetical protein [Candidatus Peribacteria bacterium]